MAGGPPNPGLKQVDHVIRRAAGHGPKRWSVRRPCLHAWVGGAGGYYAAVKRLITDRVALFIFRTVAHHAQRDVIREVFAPFDLRGLVCRGLRGGIRFLRGWRAGLLLRGCNDGGRQRSGGPTGCEQNLSIHNGTPSLLPLEYSIGPHKSNSRRPDEMAGGFDGRMKRMNRLCTVVVGICAVAVAQDPAYENYTARITVLQRDGAGIIERQGRDALIGQYRDLIDAHPGFGNNIRLETQIAMLYESDFTYLGQPPDYSAALEAYQNILAHYDADHPYMKTVRKLAADRAADLDPELALQMYESILADYPEEDALVVQSEYALGKLAEKQGQPDTAQQHFDRVLQFTPSGAQISDADAASIQAYQTNAVASMLATAIKGYDTPQERLKALKKYLDKHKELEQAYADVVHRFARSIERSTGRTQADDEGPGMSVEALLASLKKSKTGEANAPRRERNTARELRARDTVEQTRIAAVDVGDDAPANFSGAVSTVKTGGRTSTRNAEDYKLKTVIFVIVGTVGALFFAMRAFISLRRNAR